jgi:hypothetical protein
MRASSLHERRYLSPACRAVFYDSQRKKLRRAAEESNRLHRGLLRARRQRPRSRAAEQRYEFAAFQLIEEHSVPCQPVSGYTSSGRC